MKMGEMPMGKPLKLIIEALLFTADKPLRVSDIQAFLGEKTASNVKEALNELQAEYDSMGRSFALKEVAQGFQFRTHSEYAPYIVDMLKISPARLSHAAMETLAIIAYKQPILRQEIERLRGVDAGGILRTLLEKNLIRIMGRKNLPGKPIIYGTTKRFLEVFDLKDLDSLPKLKEIKELLSDSDETIASPETSQQGEAPGEENVATGKNQTQEEVSTPPPTFQPEPSS
jgi:segregation and condensation protein B